MGRGRRAATAVGLVVALAGMPLGADAQITTAPEGSSGSTWGGVALGAYSGTVFGLLGTMLPCNRTLAGARCAASGASAGAALGLAMGGIIGSQNEDAIIARAESAGWGALAGAVVGAVMWKAVRQYSYTDAAMIAAVGGAIGAAPKGAGLGAGVGAATGALAWWLLPDSGLPNFVMLTLAGVAVGGMVDWGLGAGDAKGSEPFLTPTFSIPIG
jgi:hypothetical protein